MRLIGPVVAALLLAGCPLQPPAQLSAETDDAHFRRGKELLQEGRTQEALAAFLNVVDKRGGDAPESHLELGEIFLTQVRDPIAAIYHFRRYRELKPNGPQAELVRQRIETATREFARSLPAQPLQGQVERLEMLEQIASLRRENESLRRELEARAMPMVPRDPPVAARPPAQPATPPQTLQPAPARPAQPAPPAGQRRYVVQRGDTLFRIAERMYGPGQGNRWRDIQNANRTLLPRENSPLQVGMELIIP